jgi:hypothetical protein
VHRLGRCGKEGQIRSGLAAKALLDWDVCPVWRGLGKCFMGQMKRNDDGARDEESNIRENPGSIWR